MLALLIVLLRRLAFSLLSAAALTGCSPAALLNAVLPSDHYRLFRDVPYADGAAVPVARVAGADAQASTTDPVRTRREADIFVPNASADRKPAVVVFIYGGSWQNGSRTTYHFVGEALARKGFVAVLPDYRVYPEVGFPAFVQDTAAAVAWTQRHISDYGGDPERIFLMGHSAGAHIAALLALDSSYLEAAHADRNAIRGMIGLAGPYDFLPLTDPKLQALFGPERGLARTQPINFVSAMEPPLLLLHGLDDTTVWPRNSERLAAKAAAVGAQATLIEYPGYGHLQIVVRLAAPLRSGPVLDDIARFVDSH